MPKSTLTDAYDAAVNALVEIRKAYGVSQVELGARLGWPQQFVSPVERKERRLDVIEYYAFVRATGADPEAALIELFRKLPDRVDI